MLRSAILSQIAIQMGLFEPADATALLAEYEDEAPEILFDDWLVAHDAVAEISATALQQAFLDTTFRCVRCDSTFRGAEVKAEKKMNCPFCGSTALKRIERGTWTVVSNGGVGPVSVHPDMAPTTPAMPRSVVAEVANESAEADTEIARHAMPAPERSVVWVTRELPPPPPVKLPAPPPAPPVHETPPSPVFIPGGPSPSPAGPDPFVESAHIGNWTIMGLAGEGGMGRVFKCFNPGLGQFAALKVLHSGNATVIERFRQEAKICFQLNHPNIVHVYDFGEVEGRPYIIMEWIDGESLQQRVERHGPMQTAKFLPMAVQICDALEFAHERNIIHRDIKPANIMLAGTTIKIADFGLAKVKDLQTRLTASGAILGTPSYMAPEQIHNEPVTPRTDVYSLGCTFFYLLTGREPFDGAAYHIVLHKHLVEDFPAARDRSPHIPIELDRLMQRMGAKRPKDRPKSMGEVANVLEALADTSQSATVVPSGRTVRGRTSRRIHEAPEPAPSPSFPGRVDLSVDGMLPRIEIIRVTKHLELEDCVRLESLLHALVLAGINDFILDFSATEYVNARGLWALVRVAYRAREENGRVIVANIPPKLKIVFDMLKLDEHFEIVETVQEAIHRFGDGLAGTMPLRPT